MVHEVDVHVGKRIRQRRWLTGMTQQKLAELVGIKFQQIQKYETGANRVSASRLWDIAEALEVPVAFFFEGLRASSPSARNPRKPAPPPVRTCPRAERRGLTPPAVAQDGAGPGGRGRQSPAGLRKVTQAGRSVSW